MGHMEYSDDAIEKIKARARAEVFEQYRDLTRLTGAAYREPVPFLVREEPERAARLLRIFYVTIGLGSETGEVANKIKKILRDKNGVIDSVVRSRIIGELGGVCWYLDALCDEFGFTLESVLAYNRSQILDRMNRGTLHGDGDDR